MSLRRDVMSSLLWGRGSRVLPCFGYFERTDRRAQCFGLKESICIYGTTYIRQIYIYEKSTVQLASVGLAQARPNYARASKTLRLSTLLHVLADGREGCTACFTDFVLLGLECVYTRLARVYSGTRNSKTRMGPSFKFHIFAV